MAGDSLALAQDDVEAVVSRYERHIEREESGFLPLAVLLAGGRREQPARPHRHAAPCPTGRAQGDCARNVTGGAEQRDSGRGEYRVRKHCWPRRLHRLYEFVQSKTVAYLRVRR